MSIFLKNYYFMVLVTLLIILSTISYINTYVICEDGESACDKNYHCCKKEKRKGYICCHVSKICCKGGLYCCEKPPEFRFKEIKGENPKLLFSILEPKMSFLSPNKTELEENTINNKAENINSSNEELIIKNIFDNFKNILRQFKLEALMANIPNDSYQENLAIKTKTFIEDIKNAIAKKQLDVYSNAFRNEWEKLMEFYIKEFNSFYFFKNSFYELINSIANLRQY